jgi:hypothetical protein
LADSTTKSLFPQEARKKATIILKNYGDSALNFPSVAPSCRCPLFTEAKCPFHSGVRLISSHVLHNHPTPPFLKNPRRRVFRAVRVIVV